MKFKDIINAVDTSNPVKMTKWVFLFAGVYLCAFILAIIIVCLFFKSNMQHLSLAIAASAAFSGFHFVIEKFVKKYKRIPNFPEYKKLLYGSFCATLVIQTVFAALSLLGDPIKLHNMPVNELIFIGGIGFLLTILSLFFIQLLELRSSIKSAAKKLQKNAAKELPAISSNSEPI